jgi:ABC-2 type transport system permease protein
MLLRIASFELRRRLRMLSTYVYFAIFFGIGLLWNLLAGGAFPGSVVDFGAGGKVVINAPYSLTFITLLSGFFGTVFTAAIAGRATYQDVDHRTTPFFFTAPISKLDYLGGRLLGATLSVLILYPGIALGAWVATRTPWIDATRVGPDHFLAYALPYLTVLLPNLLFTSSVFFTLATLFKRMVPVYVGAVVLVLGYLIAGNITANMDNRVLAAMIDPFGTQAVERLTEYWTIAEKNTRLVSLSGVFLYNRLLWGGLGVTLLGLTYIRFRFTESSAGKSRASEEPPEAGPITLPAPPALDFSRRASFGALAALTRLQLRETIKNVFFLVIVLAGILFMVATGLNADQIYGTRTWPVTYVMLEVAGGTFTLFVVIVITLYSGELVWRERDAGLALIFDALPIPRWVVFTSKLVALLLVQVLLLVALMVAAIALQAAKGYFHFELGLYAETLFGVKLATYWSLCCLAMLVHVLVNNKYVGHFAMILYFVVGIVLPLLGLEHNLARFDAVPRWTYSAMNGFGHFVAPIASFQIYWGALAVVFALVANALWVRGLETGLASRLRLARATVSRGAAVAMGAALLVFVGMGGFIFWNTNHLNEYRTEHENEAEQALWERTYAGEWKDAAQPSIEGVTIAFDIFPDERRVATHGTYALRNESGEPIARVAVRVPHRVEIAKLTFGRGERRTLADDTLGFYVYELPAPLAPGERATLDFDLRYQNVGFTNDRGDTSVVYNGTFVNNSPLPHIGYPDAAEISEDAKRHKFGLAPKRLPPAGDPKRSMHNYIAGDASWMDFDATVSTSTDQLAIAPGYLEREWTDNGRRYFHYTMDSKILGFYAFLSARYEVLRDSWTPPSTGCPEGAETRHPCAPDGKAVAIEIDYQPGHTYDLERMVEGAKKSLDYFTAKFGPYQHRQVRIVEFPRYETFAQSFPNTIPYSESIGFIARVNDDNPDDVDYPFYVTAHEVAHQWWGHQVVSADVQGATLLSESLAQYSALMVMKHEYGPDKMRRFLKYELDRYLRGRGTARRPETPLVKVENDGYIHYGKGSLVMYALQDYIGEDTVDATLAKFVADHAFQPPPYTDAPALVAAFRASTPAEYQYVIEDLFETITLFENRAERAVFTKRADGKYDVTVDVRAKKLRASESGGETETPVADFIDVGVLGAKGKVLALRRERFDAPAATLASCQDTLGTAQTSGSCAPFRFTFVVDEEPEKAGIDPLNKLIDRMPDDNVKKVERAD